MKHSGTEEGCGLQRIDRMTEPPVIGRFYLVPTVRYVYWGIEADWPVMGPLHDDREHLEFPYFHYHVDSRFISAALCRRLANAHFYGGLEILFAGNPLHQRDLAAGYVDKKEAMAMPAAKLRALGIPHPPIVHRRRKMHREFVYPRLEVEAIVKDRKAKDRSFLAMWAAHAGMVAQRGKHGLICPHRNYPLGNAKPDADGILTCPLHGLRICARTGLVEPGRKDAGPDTCQGAPAAHGVRPMDGGNGKA
jgi:hypothetical protein